MRIRQKFLFEREYSFAYHDVGRPDSAGETAASTSKREREAEAFAATSGD